MKKLSIGLFAVCFVCLLASGCTSQEQGTKKELASANSQLSETYGNVLSKAENYRKEIEAASGIQEYGIDVPVISQSSFDKLQKGMRYQEVMDILKVDTESAPSAEMFTCTWNGPNGAFVIVDFLQGEVIALSSSGLSAEPDNSSSSTKPHITSDGDLTDEEIPDDKRATTLAYLSVLNEKLDTMFVGLGITEPTNCTDFKLREDVSSFENNLYVYDLYFDIGDQKVAIEAMELNKKWTVSNMVDTTTNHYYYVAKPFDAAYDIYDFKSGKLISSATKTLSEISNK